MHPLTDSRCFSKMSNELRSANGSDSLGEKKCFGFFETLVASRKMGIELGTITYSFLANRADRV
jgi:hypothetical protein